MSDHAPLPPITLSDRERIICSQMICTWLVSGVQEAAVSLPDPERTEAQTAFAELLSLSAKLIGKSLEP